MQDRAWNAILNPACFAGVSPNSQKSYFFFNWKIIVPLWWKGLREQHRDNKWGESYSRVLSFSSFSYFGSKYSSHPRNTHLIAFFPFQQLPLIWFPLITPQFGRGHVYFHHSNKIEGCVCLNTVLVLPGKQLTQRRFRFLGLKELKNFKVIIKAHFVSAHFPPLPPLFLKTLPANAVADV